MRLACASLHLSGANERPGRDCTLPSVVAKHPGRIPRDCRADPGCNAGRVFDDGAFLKSEPRTSSLVVTLSDKACLATQMSDAAGGASATQRYEPEDPMLSTVNRGPIAKDVRSRCKNAPPASCSGTQSGASEAAAHRAVLRAPHTGEHPSPVRVGSTHEVPGIASKGRRGAAQGALSLHEVSAFPCALPRGPTCSCVFVRKIASSRIASRASPLSLVPASQSQQTARKDNQRSILDMQKAEHQAQKAAAVDEKSWDKLRIEQDVRAYEAEARTFYPRWSAPCTRSPHATAAQRGPPPLVRSSHT